MVPADYRVGEISRTKVNLGACNRGLLQHSTVCGNIRYTLTAGLAGRLVGGSTMLRVAAVRATCTDGSFQSDGFILEGSPMQGGMGGLERDIKRLAHKDAKTPLHMRNALQVLAGYFNCLRQLGIMVDGTVSVKRFLRFFQADTVNLVVGAFLKDSISGFGDLAKTVLSLTKPTEIGLLRSQTLLTAEGLKGIALDNFLSVLDNHDPKRYLAWVKGEEPGADWRLGLGSGKPYRIREVLNNASAQLDHGPVSLDTYEAVELLYHLIEGDKRSIPYWSTLAGLARVGPEQMLGIPLGSTNAYYFLTPWMQDVYNGMEVQLGSSEPEAEEHEPGEDQDGFLNL